MGPGIEGFSETGSDGPLSSLEPEGGGDQEDIVNEMVRMAGSDVSSAMCAGEPQIIATERGKDLLKERLSVFTFWWGGREGRG